MQRVLLWIIVVGLAMIAILLYERSRNSVNRLDVDPHAAGEIEKAKHR
jgi:hypothetical protein